MPRDRNRDMFNRGVRLFPVRHQAEINLAALYFRRVDPAHRFSNRARAWFAYAALVSDFDDFNRGNVRCWERYSRTAMPDDQVFRDEATRLAEAARTSETGTWRYDCCWALAYIYLMQGSFQSAEQELETALAANDLGNGAYRDVNLLMDAADFAVHLGRLTPMPGPNGNLKSARQLIAAAHLAVPDPDERPDWWSWVEAWVKFAEAVQTPPLNGATLAACDSLLTSILDPSIRNVDQEYDAWALHAVVRKLQGDDQGARALWTRLTEQKREDRENPNYQWTAAKERRRTPLWLVPSRPATAALQTAYHNTLAQL